MLNCITIPDEVLVLLDGKCDEKVQRDIDGAKLRLESIKNMPDIEPKIAEFFADLKRIALGSGRLIYQNKSVNYCPVCGKRGGYAKYKSGRNCGRSNYNRRLTFGGIEFQCSFVTFKDKFNFGCCYDCLKKVKPLLPLLADLKASIPVEITGIPQRYEWRKKYKCTVCGWEGGEHQMGRSPCLMGGGTYPSTCPKCGERNKPLLDSKVEVAPGYVLTEV